MQQWNRSEASYIEVIAVSSSVDGCWLEEEEKEEEEGKEEKEKEEEEEEDVEVEGSKG